MKCKTTKLSMLLSVIFSKIISAQPLDHGSELSGNSALENSRVTPQLSFIISTGTGATFSIYGTYVDIQRNRNTHTRHEKHAHVLNRAKKIGLLANRINQ
ncbi:hypothetical protein PA25_36170 [Pseudoalteromonas sp. A25]|nr:hypothetical protein PA25_36170 [Pseudoalteromonas sp. A25]